MGARPEHGVLSHALALSANGVDVGEVDEVVEDEGGRDSGREREKENVRVGEREKEKERTGSCKEAEQERNEEKKRGRGGGGRDGG